LTLTSLLRSQRNQDRNVTSALSYIKEYMYAYVAQRVVGMNWSLSEGGFRSMMTQTPIRFHLECTSLNSTDHLTHNSIVLIQKNLLFN